MKNYKRNFFLLLLISFFACLSLGWYAYNEAHKSNILQDQVAALTDTVTIYKTKDGKNGAYIRVIMGDKKQVMDILEKRDAKIAELAKKTPGIKIITDVKTETRIDTVVRIDTIRLATATTPLLIKKQIDNPWYTANIEIKSDSLNFKLRNRDEFYIMHRDKPTGFLKPKTYIIDVINKNPNSFNTGLSAYEFTPKSKNGLKISIAIAAGIGAYLILK